MKWFHHNSDSHIDAKLARLCMRYGMEGYGLYWYLLEHIALKVTQHNLTFELEHDAEVLGHILHMNVDHIQEMMRYMVELELFENSEGRITCLKLLKRLDTSMTSNAKFRKLIIEAKEKHFGVPDKSHDPIMTESCKKVEGRSQKVEVTGENRKRFVPPTIEQISEYFSGSVDELTSRREAEKFWNFYESKGWYVGKSKMKVWKSSAANWIADKKTKTQQVRDWN